MLKQWSHFNVTAYKTLLGVFNFAITEEKTQSLTTLTF